MGTAKGKVHKSVRLALQMERPHRAVPCNSLNGSLSGALFLRLEKIQRRRKKKILIAKTIFG